MEKEPDKKYEIMKKIMDVLEDILCSYQDRGHQSVCVDLDFLALFTRLIAYRQIQALSWYVGKSCLMGFASCLKICRD